MPIEVYTPYKGPISTNQNDWMLDVKDRNMEGSHYTDILIIYGKNRWNTVRKCTMKELAEY